MKEFSVEIKVPAGELARWDKLLNQKHVDYKKEGFGENRCVFVKSARFEDGMFADVKICTNLKDGDIYCEMVVYDTNGRNLWLSDTGSTLSGSWRVGGWSEGSETYYQVDVVPDVPDTPMDMFARLGVEREDFVEMVRHELENGVTTEYSEAIARAIADKVADDVYICGDPVEWSVGDVRLGTGRILSDAVGAHT